MMKRLPLAFWLFVGALLLSCSVVPFQAQEWAKTRLEASPRHHEYVALHHGSRTLQAFVVYPEVKQKATTVILIHEIFGLTDWAKEMADELAAQGFIVVAPDLLSGSGPTEEAQANSPARTPPSRPSPRSTRMASTPILMPQPIMQRRFQRPTARSLRLDSAGAAASPSPSRRIARTSRRPLSFTVPALRKCQRLMLRSTPSMPVTTPASAQQCPQQPRP